jgi:hypothetical protein
MIIIFIRKIIIMIKYGYYSLTTYEIIDVLDYNLNKHARLNNTVITICKLK